jgi:hypothetical protein
MIYQGKQKIWSDYQKEIPEDHWFYVRSCIRQSFFPGAERQFMSICRDRLGHDIYETAHHTTCGGIAYHSDVIPQETAMTIVARQFAMMTEAGYKKVVLRPLMVVAGDHANNDMAGDDDDSWFSEFKATGSFEAVECQVVGLGRIDSIQKIYIAHTADAIANSGSAAGASAAKAADLPDGTYTAEFDTDSSMFKVNESLDDKGTLTVKDGKMTIHVSLISKKILNLYVGKAADAEKASENEILQPTTDTVTYADGTTEEVYGFDVPVPGIDQDFDLAIIGEKGVWYDHVVSVEDPVPAE